MKKKTTIVSRLLNFCRACDPDKRISLAFDSMLSEDSGDLSYCSQLLSVMDNHCLATIDPVHSVHPADGVGPVGAVGPAAPAQTMAEKYAHPDPMEPLGWWQKQLRSASAANNLDFVHFYAVFQATLQNLVSKPWLDFIITVSILLNTGFLATEHHGMSPDVKQVLDVGNKVSRRWKLRINIIKKFQLNLIPIFLLFCFKI